jgi:hypothetical protein
VTEMAKVNLTELIKLLNAAQRNEALCMDGVRRVLAALRDDPDSLIREACHELEHFFTDNDIRQRDKEYGSIMRGKLARYAEELSKRSPDGMK